MKENNAINCQILKNHPTPFYSWPRLISLKSFLSFFFPPGRQRETAEPCVATARNTPVSRSVGSAMREEKKKKEKKKRKASR